MTQWSTTEPEFLDLCEVPPAGSGKIKEFSNASVWCNFQYWLIKKIAGKRTIIINAHIGLIPRLEDRNVLARATKTGKGLYLNDSYLWCDDENMLLLSNRAK